MKEKFWTSEKLMSTIAMIIGFGTLIVFIYQTNLIRKQQYMSVYPHLTIGYSYTSEKMEYTISNKGIGPALITNIRIVDEKGNEFSDVITCFQKIFSEEGLKFVYSYSNISVGDLISEKDKISVIQINKPEKEKIQILFSALSRISDFEIQYESIYGEKWKITDDGKRPVKIE